MKLRRTLLVDDEILARKALRQSLAAHPEIEVVGEAGSADEALALHQKLRPDLIFLDVQMPKKDAFALLPDLLPMPDIIFVTAFDCFAVKAFEINAVDYLVKPITPDRLALALSRIAKPRKPKPFANDDSIILRSDMGGRVVLATEIACIEAEGNYSRVHIAHKDSLFIRRTMAEWERLLPAETFRRVNRSTLVNLRAVREIRPLPLHHTAVGFTGLPSRIELGRLASRRLRKALSSLIIA